MARTVMTRLVPVLALLCIALVALALLVGRALTADQLALDPDSSGGRSIVLLDMRRNFAYRLTRADGDSYAPAWSPDGTRLAYLSAVLDTQTVFVIDTQSGRKRAIFNGHTLDGANGSVAWSPDGERLAFTAEVDGRQVIFVADLTRDQTFQQITSSVANAFSPTWSADGRALAFAWSLRDNTEIYAAAVQELDVPVSSSSSLHRLTSIPAMDSRPAWSPDGTRIAFVSDRDENSEIYVMDADGNNLRRLTANPARDALPTWLPDSRSILFASTRDGDWRVYRLDADCDPPESCAAVPLSLPLTFESAPKAAWRPAPPS